MSTEQQPFLDEIAKNEDDQTARLIYADWLEDHGMVDEALRQRSWIAAKQELIDILDLNRPLSGDEYYDYDGPTSFDEFIEMLTDSLDDEYVHFGNRETLMDEYRNNRETVWRLWSIITGKPCPIALPYGSCSC